MQRVKMNCNSTYILMEFYPLVLFSEEINLALFSKTVEDILQT